MSDGVSLAVQKSDIKDSTHKDLLITRVTDTTNVGSDQGGVSLVAQVGRENEGSPSRKAGELHYLVVGGEIGGNYYHNQGLENEGRRSG